ncbi:unnamed protein product [Didymodactylos carnosus]|uniref:Glucose-inhibited division protein A n=1 Tax=Didymodactylos carnosus TaxID=1234261 RepID=A0A8S2CWH9_9BILA|nr:unnamed protein product [Didymodactylos carnosus]CAF3565385.1 unnamed protein product [Didymodactylos carnosus]
MKFDVIVIGGGHAGIEAALASARMQATTAMVTLSKSMIGNMPCNPSIGGPAKGTVTREINALGGEQALRAQIDKVEYPRYMIKALENSQVNIIESECIQLIIEENKIDGIVLATGERILAKAVIITSGTYARSQTLCGKERVSSGPDGQKSASLLSEQLIKLGLKTIRLKTGTPPRIHKESIDYSQMQIETGNGINLAFSEETNKFLPVSDQ